MKRHRSFFKRLGAIGMLVLSGGLNDAPAQSGGSAAEPSSAATETVSPSSGSQEEVVRMSQFEVTTTQGHGYVSTNAASAFKTNEPLMNIPQADIVVTNDLIQDLNYENSSDVLQYFGVQALITGECLTLRGSDVQNEVYVDDTPTYAFYEDDVIIDSYEVIKGPAQTLYVNGALAGSILKATKKPLPYNQDIFTASVDANGLFRLTADMTGPIGKVGGMELFYRLIGLYQHGDEYFQNMDDNRYLVFPEFSLKYHNTTVRAYYNVETIYAGSGRGTLTPSGDLYTGAGWKYAEQAPNDGILEQEWQTRNLFLEVLQKISDSWEDKLTAMEYRSNWYGADPLINYANFVNNTENWYELLADEKWNYWTVLNDCQGHYALGSGNWRIENRDAFGFSFSSDTNKEAFWETAPLPYPNGPFGGSVTVPLDNGPAIAAIPYAPSSANPPPSSGSLGGYYEIEQSSIYWQHTMDVIPNWLTLVAAWTWCNAAEQAIGNWGTLPFQATDTTVSQWIHRWGAVLHLTNAVSIYVLDSTSFTPPFNTTVLENGELPPTQIGTGTELGMKWNMLNGRISGEAAWFRMVTTNGLNLDAGTNNGIQYAAVIGSTTEEGVDGDAAFTLVPGWQVIGSWYAGHMVDPYGNPVNFSYDNSWSAFTRFDFAKTGPLNGLSVGGGISRMGGRWMSTGGEIASYNLPALVKIQTGTSLNGFVSYRINKHWLVRVNCANILNQAYPMGAQGWTYVDPSEPRLFSLLTSFNF